MFKVGEKIRCIVSEGGQFTKGRVYIVRSVDNQYQRVRIEKDDRGETNGWNAQYFESVEKELLYKEILEEDDEIPF